MLTASALGPNEIELRWTSVPGAVRYVLYVQLVDAPGWQQIGGGNLQGTSHTHGELTPGKAYQFAVRGIDANDQPAGTVVELPHRDHSRFRCAHLNSDAYADPGGDTDSDAYTDARTNADYDVYTDPGSNTDSDAGRNIAHGAGADCDFRGFQRDRAQMDVGPRRGQVRALHATGRQSGLAAT